MIERNNRIICIELWSPGIISSLNSPHSWHQFSPLKASELNGSPIKISEERRQEAHDANGDEYQNFLGLDVWVSDAWVSSMKLLSSPKSIFHVDDLNFFQVLFLLQIWGRVVKILAYGHKKLLM